MQFCVKVVLLNSSYSIQIGEQSENDNIPQEPENLRFVPVINFFYFAFLIVIIDNIIDMSVSCDQNSHQWQCCIIVM